MPRIYCILELLSPFLHLEFESSEDTCHFIAIFQNLFYDTKITAFRTIYKGQLIRRFLVTYFIIIIFRGPRTLMMHQNFEMLVSFLVPSCMQCVFSHMRYTISQMRYNVSLFPQNIIYSRVNDDHKKKPIFINPTTSILFAGTNQCGKKMKTF